VRLAQEGADIIALDALTNVSTVPYPMATEADLAETVRLVEALDRRVVSRQADVRDLAALTAAVRDGVAELGRLDIVVANAGVGGYGLLHEIAEDAWEDMMAINLTGVWKTLRATVPAMIEGGRGGSVILISSAAGLKGVPGIGHYVTAKHGLVGMARSAALELAPLNIRVNSLHPGTVDTDFIQNEATYRIFRPDLDAPSRQDFDLTARTLMALDIPYLDPIDVSNAVLYLASEEARYVTGSAMSVDAGMTTK
jgi:(+)-trans-carveol dehydrogenase/(-)-trans-carveol dehydrogenase